jgi:pimeloyl-ACP methyl ester carboxylesterase
VARVDHTHVTVPTRFVENDGIRFAYRRLGEESGVPLLFFQHFRGGMDHWDPAVTDGFAQDRPVVLFDNAGVAGTSGETPNSIEAMADHAAAFVGALGLSQVDVLGFSIGGYVSQTLALRHRTLVRRISQHIPRAQLIIYPDSGHGVLFQFPELFVAHGPM